MSALPKRQALNPFLYTSYPTLRPNIIPKDASDGMAKDELTGNFKPVKRFEVGHLISVTQGFMKTGSQWQQTGQATYLEGDLHDPSYADPAALKLLGVSIGEAPQNRPSMVDAFGDLSNEDFGINVDTSIASFMERLAVAASSSIVLVKLWDTINNQLEVLDNTSIGLPVFASKTGIDGGSVSHTGASGFGSISAGQSTVAGIAQIGMVYAVPINGDHRAYILFNPALARRVV